MLEAAVELGEGFGFLALAEEADGEVEVVVGVVGVCGGGLAVEGDGVFAAAAEGDALVVDDFRQGQDAGDGGEGFFGVLVVAAEELGEAAVEAGFEFGGVAASDAAEADGGGLVLLRGELEAADGEPCGGEMGVEVGGFLEVALALVDIALGDAADVLLEGIEAEGGAGGAEGLLGDGEVGVELAGELPCE